MHSVINGNIYRIMIQKLIFTAGMNMDISPEYLKEGESRKNIDVRVLSSDGDQQMSAETMLGNTLVSYSLPQGTNKVIGTKEDKTRGLNYYFVWNSAKHHLILEYNIQTNTIAKVLQEAAALPYYLDFDIDHLITGVVIIEFDVNNHLLYWTDYHTEPKKINIEKAKFFSAGDFVNGYKSPFDPDIVYQIKKPQLSPPSYVWSTDSAQLINYLFKKNFIFKVQFLYDDKDISSWSPISDYVLPQTTTSGTNEDILTQSNKITITVETGSSIVTKVRIAAQELNTTDFKLIAELDKSKLNIADNTTYDFDFYNNGNYVILEINESIKLFDSIPFLAKAQDSIENSRLVPSNIVEGIDPVNIDMRLPVSYIQVPANANTAYPKQSQLKSGGAYKFGIVYYEGKGNRSGTTNVTDGKTTGAPSDALAYDRYGTFLYLPFTTDPLNDPPRAAPYYGLDYVPQVGVEIYNPPPLDETITHYQILRSKNEAMDRYIQFSAQNVLYLASDYTTIVAPATASEVLINIGNIPGRYLTENSNSKLVYGFVPGDRIRFIANNHWITLTPLSGSLAPTGGNWPAYATTVPAASTAVDPLFAFNDNEILSYDAGTGNIHIRMNSTVPDNLLPGVLFEIYQPAENVIGDNEIMFEMGEYHEIITDIHGNRVHDGVTSQLIEVMISSTNPGANTYVATLPSGHSILAADKVKIVATGCSIYGLVTSTTLTTATIDTTGYTLVGTYSGANPGTVTRAALFNLEGGDSFRRFQDAPWLAPAVNRLYAWVDCENASNMFASKAWNVGRPNRIDPLYRRIARTTTCYFTEKFIPETNINGLSTVYDTSFQSYDPRFRSIQRVYYENHRLIVFFELKVGKIPVEQIVYNDLQLNDAVGASTVVLSPNIVYDVGEYGIGKNPESFAVYAQSKYFIDIRRGALLRLSNDGITCISDEANMHNYFTDKCREMLQEPHGNSKIYGVYDTKFSEYIISFEGFRKLDATVVSGETLAFNEQTNLFSSFYSYLPDFMCGADNDIITFKNGQLYTHNTNSTYCNFYGAQYQSELWRVGNMNPSSVKVLQAIGEEAVSAWELYSITTPEGQESNLIVSDFSLIEGQQFASVLRDVNTPDIVSPALPIFEGDPMRSTTFLCKFRYPLTGYNKIFAVNLKYAISNLHY